MDWLIIPIIAFDISVGLLGFDSAPGAFRRYFAAKKLESLRISADSRIKKPLADLHSRMSDAQGVEANF
jgi:hypothetical protein